ncbi:HEAT repeat domain-containing protein [Saccharopolyspora sp. NPDC002376]
MRAAVELAATRAPHSLAERHLTTLLNDENWHVRECALRSLDPLGPGHPRQELVHTALAVIKGLPRVWLSLGFEWFRPRVRWCRWSQTRPG